MAPKHDIGQEHVQPVGGSRRIIKYKYYSKVIHKGITRLKQHIAYISRQIEGYPCVLVEVLQSVRLHMFDTSKEKTQVKKMKKRLLSSLNEKKNYGIDKADSNDEIEEVDAVDFGRR